MSKPRVAVTMGDPAGIGPEIILKAVHALRPRMAAGELALGVTGGAAIFARTAEALGLANPLRPLAPGEAIGETREACLIEVGSGSDAVATGEVSAAAGKLAYDAIDWAVRLAMDGAVDAICTAPINKDALNRAGHHYSGHTELLADLTGAADSVMMLAHGDMRVSHVSTHTALRKVYERLTPERLRRVVLLTAGALRQLGIQHPRIAVAALNPHAGEGGLFGREDIDISAPTIAALVAEGHDVTGPVPGDTVFVRLRAGQYDAVVAMYHDQGHIPVKLLGFSVDAATGKWNALSGVNITLGLPIIRTSVDHGTAFDIAGRGIASETSLLEAIDFAIRLAATR
jgi:4-hydroxythreonine-4-phosphate dehydrogenase